MCTSWYAACKGDVEDVPVFTLSERRRLVKISLRGTGLQMAPTWKRSEWPLLKVSQLIDKLQLSIVILKHGT